MAEKALEGELIDDDDATAEIHAQLKEDPLFFSHYYFPNHVRSATPSFHIHLLDKAVQYRHLALACPRGSAKSTVLTFFYSCHGIFFKRFRFIVIVQNTFTKAAMSLDTIKTELQTNQHLRADFPGLEIVKDAEGDSEIRHPDGFTTKILCKGMDQIGSIRGVKFGAYRPDLIICDDLEDDKSVLNPELRRDLRDLYDDALVPAGEEGVTQYIYIGTILHDDALLTHLLAKEEYPEYCKILYQAHIKPFEGVENGERSLWPEKWTVERLHWLAKNKPGTYAKEMQNDPLAGSERRFHKSDFRTWKREGNDYVLYDAEGKICSRGALKDCKAAIAIDLAWREERRFDSSVLMPGFITPNSDYLFDEYISEKGLRPDRLEEYVFEMEKRLRKITGKSVTIGIEKAMLETVNKWLLKRAMRQRDHFLIIKPLLWDLNKYQRIETRLQPLYAQHVAYHRAGMGELEQQLLRFPSGTHDDLADGVQGLVQLLKKPGKPTEEALPQDEFAWWRQKLIDKQEAKQFDGITSPDADGFYELPYIDSFS